MSDSTRVILIDMPTLLRDLMRNAVNAAGMVVVAEHETAAEALDGLELRPGPLVVVGAAEELGEDVVARLLARAPDARVLTIAVGGAGATLHELRPHRKALGDASPSRLVAALSEVG